MAISPDSGWATPSRQKMFEIMEEYCKGRISSLQLFADVCGASKYIHTNQNCYGRVTHIEQFQLVSRLVDLGALETAEVVSELDDEDYFEMTHIVSRLHEEDMSPKRPYIMLDDEDCAKEIPPQKWKDENFMYRVKKFFGHY